MNTLKITAILVLAGAISTPAMADDTYYDSARVLSVSPHTESVNNPRQECHTEYTREISSSNSDHSYTGAIIGGVGGGLLGGQVGKGKGRVAAAAIGAVTGALVGDHLGNQPTQSYNDRPIERCTSVDNWQTVTRGYQVTYSYNGRDYTTIMPNDPGQSIRIRVSIAPEAGNSVSYLEPRYRGDRDDRREHRDSASGGWPRDRWGN